MRLTETSHIDPIRCLQHGLVWFELILTVPTVYNRNQRTIRLYVFALPDFVESKRTTHTRVDRFIFF